MMQHLIVFPVVLPLIAGILMLYQRQGLVRYKRTVSVAATLLLLLVAIGLVRQAASGDVTYYALGDWQAPFGIVLVLDRLSALMVLLTATLAVGAVVFACAGDDEKGSNFHGLFQWQLLGINGAFLTGDLFNLFVFFEVLLLASYALLLHGGGKARIQASVHYVVLNLAGSSLFLIAVGILYGATGTLNMADMAIRVADLPVEREGLVTAGALMLLVVFALKSAMLPLYFWLPKAYASAPAPVAALFAIMTKVGVYAILRVYSLIFGDSAGDLEALEQPWVWWLSLATIAAAGAGVMAARDLRLLVAYLVLVSVGTLLAGIGIGTPQAISALLYYLIHTTLITGGLFLLAEMIGLQRGKAGTRLVKGRPMVQGPALGILFF
ncbi:MAG: monovalent cation/H+ antiporter subunit D, partial [Halomonas sp.]